ncbi:hypothetical protein DFH09DRAFT_1101665 [Mycena vulgaris]|nr:hypothetical protein DFH09DRAFT_1101665 [Mycena vulgaris]
MAMRQHLDAQRAVQAAIAAVPNLEPPPVQLEVHSLPRMEPQQTVLVFTSAEQNGDYELQEIARATKKARLAVEQENPKTKRSARRWKRISNCTQVLAPSHASRARAAGGEFVAGAACAACKTQNTRCASLMHGVFAPEMGARFVFSECPYDECEGRGSEVEAHKRVHTERDGDALNGGFNENEPRLVLRATEWCAAPSGACLRSNAATQAGVCGRDVESAASRAHKTAAGLGGSGTARGGGALEGEDAPPQVHRQDAARTNDTGPIWRMNEGRWKEGVKNTHRVCCVLAPSGPLSRVEDAMGEDSSVTAPSAERRGDVRVLISDISPPNPDLINWNLRAFGASPEQN